MAQTCIIRSHWLPLAGGRMDAAFWCAIDDQLLTMGVHPAQASLIDVEKAIAIYNAEQEKLIAGALAKRDLAKVLVDEARLMERGITKPGYHRQ